MSAEMVGSGVSNPATPAPDMKLGDCIIELVSEFASQFKGDDVEKSITLATRFENNLESLLKLYGDVESLFTKLIENYDGNPIARDPLLKFLRSKLELVTELTDKQEQVFLELRVFVQQIDKSHSFLKFLNVEFTTFIKVELNFAILVRFLYALVCAKDQEEINVLKSEITRAIKKYHDDLKSVVTTSTRSIEELIVSLESPAVPDTIVKKYFLEILEKCRAVIKYIRSSYSMN